MLAATAQQIKTGFGGWKNLVFKNAAVERLAEYRQLVCNRCEHRQAITCGLCGCPLAAKQRAKDASCPDGRWLQGSIEKAA